MVLVEVFYCTLRNLVVLCFPLEKYICIRENQPLRHDDMAGRREITRKTLTRLSIVENDSTNLKIL